MRSHQETALRRPCGGLLLSGFELLGAMTAPFHQRPRSTPDRRAISASIGIGIGIGID
jgi:hypothetical protein